MPRTLLAAVLLALPVPSLGQFQATPMRVPKAHGATVEVAPLVSAPSADVLAAKVPGEGDVNALFRARDFPRSAPIPYASLRPATAYAAGLLGGDDLPDLVWADGAAGEIAVAFGAAPGTLRRFEAGGRPEAVTLARLLDRRAALLVVPVDTRALVTDPTRFEAVAADFDAAGDLVAAASWAAPEGLVPNTWARPRFLPVRLSPAARGGAGVDLVLTVQDVAFLLWQAGGDALAPSLLAPVALGDPADPAAHLPASVVPPVWIHGAAALDVDGDGVPDLLFAAVPKDGSGPGRLLWVRSDGTPASLAAPWSELSPGPGVGEVASAWLVRPLEVEGAPAAAVWDRGSQEILVLTSGPGGLAALRLPVPGVYVEDVLQADVVGTAAADLVVPCLDLAGGTEQWIQIFPDEGDPAPTVAFSPGPPGPAPRGRDLPLAVEAADDGSFRVDWVIGPADAAPAGEGLAFVLPGSALCQPGEPPTVIARATDALGVYAEVSATVEISPGGPTIGIAGAERPGRIVLRPGGTPAALEAEAWPGCGGPVSFAWSASGIDPVEDGGLESGPTWSRWHLVLPDAAYPGLLDGSPRVEVAATEGAFSGSASLLLAPDGSGLVEVLHAADRPRLAPGERALLTTRLRSRIAAPLPAVRVRHALDGLVPDGPPAVRGAVMTGSDALGTEVALDRLPPAGEEVTVELPVRSSGGPAASAASVVTAGGAPLSPGAEARAAGTPAPGCTCGGGDAGGLWLLLAAAALRRRRPPLT
jgi:hypothetical protein